MIVVDTHVHVALHTYDPVEILLTQMQYNNVEKTVSSSLHRNQGQAVLRGERSIQ